jgi:hypothetical protein
MKIPPFLRNISKEQSFRKLFLSDLLLSIQIRYGPGKAEHLKVSSGRKLAGLIDLLQPFFLTLPQPDILLYLSLGHLRIKMKCLARYRFSWMLLAASILCR